MKQRSERRNAGTFGAVTRAIAVALVMVLASSAVTWAKRPSKAVVAGQVTTVDTIPMCVYETPYAQRVAQVSQRLADQGLFTLRSRFIQAFWPPPTLECVSDNRLSKYRR